MGDLVEVGQTILRGEGNLLRQVILATPGVVPTSMTVFPTNAITRRSNILSKWEESHSRPQRWRSQNGLALALAARMSTSCMGQMEGLVELLKSHSALKQMQRQQWQSTDKTWAQGISNSSMKPATDEQKLNLHPLHFSMWQDAFVNCIAKYV